MYVPIYFILDLTCLVGEHNGFLGGHRYFFCTEGHGIFANPEKVQVISEPKVI